jgi:hypothetical protein
VDAVFAFDDPSVEWRHDPRGFVVGLSPNDRPRVKVWHRSLQVEPFVTREIRDHRFGFSSTVIAGQLVNIEVSAWPMPNGQFSVWEVEPSDRGQVNVRLPGTVTPVEVVVHVSAGESYLFPRGTFRRVTPAYDLNGVTVEVLKVDAPDLTVKKRVVSAGAPCDIDDRRSKAHPSTIRMVVEAARVSLEPRLIDR